LENEGYAVGAADLCAAGVQAPHIRQRLWFVAHIESDGRGKERTDDRREPEGDSSQGRPAGLESGSLLGELADSSSPRLAGRPLEPARQEFETVERSGNAGEAMEYAESKQTRIPGRPWFPRGADSADWIECTDGKWRPVEPLAQQMANGLSVGLGCVRGLGDTEKEALINATQSTGFAAETLSAVRQGNDPAEIWRTIGGRLGFPAASVLLALLCQYSGELGVVFYGAAPGGPEGREADLRAVRERRPFTCSPPRRGLSEQSAGELTDLVSKVSQAHPSLAAFNGFPLSKGVSGRVGLLRGYGNAIVPQVAAEFVRATMELTG
jgi:hypothetical protein